MLKEVLLPSSVNVIGRMYTKIEEELPFILVLTLINLLLY